MRSQRTRTDGATVRDPRFRPRRGRAQGRVGRRSGRSSQSGRRRPPGPGPGRARALHSRYTTPAMNRLKIVAIVYVVKTLLLVIAWLVVPDLPERAMAKARETWTAVSTSARR